MGINNPYVSADQLPEVIPVFPLAGALILPRGQLPLNIFEPRYVRMIDDSLMSHRLIGMIQPDERRHVQARVTSLHQVGCVGRITQFAETGDGRYLMTLTGVARFRVMEELSVITPYRQCRVAFKEFEADLNVQDEAQVDRTSVIRTLKLFAETNKLKLDWNEIDRAPNEALVNALAMMSPFGPSEKQALLEAADLKSRAEVLVAITEIELAKGGGAPPSLQ
jgi:Lon protease-like protein